MKEPIKTKFTFSGDWPFQSTLTFHASSITDGDREAYFLPFWFEKTKDGFEAHRLGQLPPWLMKQIKKHRLDDTT